MLLLIQTEVFNDLPWARQGACWGVTAGRWHSHVAPYQKEWAQYHMFCHLPIWRENQLKGEHLICQSHDRLGSSSVFVEDLPGLVERNTVYSDHLSDVRLFALFLFYLTQCNKDFIALREALSIDMAQTISQAFLLFFIICTLLLGICSSVLWLHIEEVVNQVWLQIGCTWLDWIDFALLYISAFCF